MDIAVLGGGNGSLAAAVDLTEQGAYLHVRFAFVLQHLEAQGGLFWVVKIVLHIIAFEVFEAGFKADGALLQDSELLVTHGHVVKCQHENEFVMVNFV